MKIFISAGDPSGDLHAAKLMVALKQKLPNIEFVGIGGSNMIEEGLTTIVPLSKMSVVGFWEVAKRYTFFKKIFNQCVNILKNDKIDAFIPVDYPGFNMRLAEHSKKFNIPVIYYIAPQLWAWGKNRAEKLSKSTDLLLTVFPFEVDFFRNYNINTKFVGHPLLDDEYFKNEFLPYKSKESILALLPGSRQQEIIKNLPIMAEIANKFISKHTNFKVGIAVSKSIDKSYILDYVKSNQFKFELFDNSYELMKFAKLGIVKTGTSNLEAALSGMPFVMLYKTSVISYFFGKKLVNMPYISLINILSADFIIKEYIQNFKIEDVTNELSHIVEDIDKYNTLQNIFRTIKTNLGSSGGSEKAASEIINYLRT